MVDLSSRSCVTVIQQAVYESDQPAGVRVISLLPQKLEQPSRSFRIWESLMAAGFLLQFDLAVHKQVTVTGPVLETRKTKRE